MSLLLSTDRLLCVEMLCLLVLLAELLPGSDKRRLTRTRLGSYTQNSVPGSPFLGMRTELYPFALTRARLRLLSPSNPTSSTLPKSTSHSSTTPFLCAFRDASCTEAAK
jgi:hypothetical protein